VFAPAWARAALSRRVFTGLSRQHLADLTVELADPWTAAHQASLHHRRGHARRRAAGAGPHHRLVLVDRVLATLVILRLQLPHQALAVLYGVDRATITRAVGEVRPLLAARGFAVPDLPGVRLRTLADVFAYAAAHGVELRIDGTETQVRRPRAHRAGRRAFVSGKRKQNTIKTTAISDGRGRTLWAGAVRPGRMHDQTAVKTEGIEDLFHQYPTVTARVDTGYRGLAKVFPIGSAPRRSHRPRPPQPSRWPPTGRPANGSRPSGSVWSMPSPSTSSGGPCSATSDAARPTLGRIWPSPAWSPTGPPAAERATRVRQANTSQPQSRTKSLGPTRRPAGYAGWVLPGGKSVAAAVPTA
jgi:hypothetical protein